jgi:beta-N-acetylhexosaminidase
MTLNLPGLFCVGFDGLTVPDTLLPLLEQGLGGVILFKRNLESLEQICRLTAALHASAAAPLLIGVDQEGGRVTRLPAPFLFPPAAGVLGQLDDPGLTEELARAVGRELRAAGMNWDLAPVLDVRTNPANPVIGDRAYSEDPERVARMGLAVLRGFEDSGILATAKHFPGHGETAADSHLTLPESRQPAARWRSVEFRPFIEAIRHGVPSVMVAHLACPGLDPNAPTSLSRVVIGDILRTELGFAGMVVSDDMEMGAITSRFDVGEAAVRFLEAGGDLILVCRQSDLQYQALAAVESAVRDGRLTEMQIEASLARIARAHARHASDPTNLPVDLQTARKTIGSASHSALLQKVRTFLET